LDSVAFDGISYETRHVAVPGGTVVTYSVGTGAETLLIVSGGPGLSCDYVREPHASLAGEGYRIVSYDQLGCGASDRPNDRRLWTLERAVKELEAVRSALALDAVHLLGQSWGAFLALEYALGHPGHIKTLTLEGGAASIPHAITGVQRLRAALGSETLTMMERHEAEGTQGHPEYQAAITILTWRHVCRLQEFPPSLLRSIDSNNLEYFDAVQGKSDFVFTGNLKDWDRLADLGRMTRPVLLLCGYHDVATPACSALMHQRFPKSRMKIFQNSSHLPFIEEPEEYFSVLRAFLDEHTGAKL
jgi:proline iminopeptidase